MLRCVNDDVTTIKPGHQATGNARVIWSNESFFTPFPASAYNPECRVPTVKQVGGSLTVWAAISWYSVGPIITHHGRITARDYGTWTGWVIRCIPRSRLYFRTTIQFSKKIMLPFTQLELLYHGLKDMKLNFNIFPGQHNYHI
jgi:hypothetical protein